MGQRKEKETVVINPKNVDVISDLKLDRTAQDEFFSSCLTLEAHVGFRNLCSKYNLSVRLNSDTEL